MKEQVIQTIQSPFFPKEFFYSIRNQPPYSTINIHTIALNDKSSYIHAKPQYPLNKKAWEQCILDTLYYTHPHCVRADW